MRLSKIFSHIEYGENLNLGFIVGTPGNTDINPDCDYTLFSVLVHKGTSPQNGHYFVFVNTSDNC
jgi:ubiquitin C-terminal hydrolase